MPATSGTASSSTPSAHLRKIRAVHLLPRVPRREVRRRSRAGQARRMSRLPRSARRNHARPRTANGRRLTMCGRCHESITPRTNGAALRRYQKVNAIPATRPTGRDFPKLLDRVGDSMCLTCHTEFDDKLATATFTHRAICNGCLQCHDAHGSTSPASTTQPVVKQCVGCHEKISTKMTSSRLVHSATPGDRSCLNCHTPHGSSIKMLMKDTHARHLHGLP